MNAYVVVDITVKDAKPFMKYVGQVSSLIKKHGGRYLVQGAEPETLLALHESPRHVVILEFPSRTAANEFFEERSSLGLAELFNRSTISRILLADGVEHDEPA